MSHPSDDARQVRHRQKGQAEDIARRRPDEGTSFSAGIFEVTRVTPLPDSGPEPGKTFADYGIFARRARLQETDPPSDHMDFVLYGVETRIVNLGNATITAPIDSDDDVRFRELCWSIGGTLVFRHDDH